MHAPIVVAVTRRVLPGREDEFLSRLQDFAKRTAGQPGSLGVTCLSPAVENGEYGLLHTFASKADQEAFYNSAAYRDWLEEIKDLVEGSADMKELHGLEAFFRQENAEEPPRWKMAIITWLGVVPTVGIWALLLDPYFDGPFLLELAVSNVFVVAMLTWVVMPNLGRAFQPWLKS